MKNPQALCYNKFRLRTGDFLCAKVRNMCWKTGGSYMEKKKKSMKLRTRVIISFFIISQSPLVCYDYSIIAYFTVLVNIFYNYFSCILLFLSLLYIINW